MAVSTFGCAREDISYEPTFKDIVGGLRELAPLSAGPIPIEARVSISVQDAEIRDILRVFLDESGVSIISDSKLDDRRVSLEVEDQPIDDVLQLLARKVGSDLSRSGDIYYLGELAAEDRAVLVRKVARMDLEGLLAAGRVMLSDKGGIEAQADGVVIVSDRVAILEKVDSMFDQIEALPNDVWVVQFYLISVDESLQRELGVGLDGQLEVSWLFAGVAGGLKSFVLDTNETVEGAALVRAFGRMARESEDVSIVAAPLFLLSDGEEGRFVSGDAIPIPRRTTSSEGTVTTEGFDFVQTGFEVELALREVSPSSAKIGVSVSLSDVQGFVEEAPITTERSYEGTFVCQSGGVYLIGSLDRSIHRKIDRGFVSFLRTRSDVDTTVQVWVKATKVFSSFEVSL